jgi:hypothetical protein
VATGNGPRDTAGKYSFVPPQFIEAGAKFNSGRGCRGRGHQNARRQDIQGYTRPSDAILPWLEGFLNPPPAQRTFVEKQYGEFAQSADAILYSGFHTVSEFDPATSATFVRT